MTQILEKFRQLRRSFARRVTIMEDRLALWDRRLSFYDLTGVLSAWSRLLKIERSLTQIPALRTPRRSL